MNVCTLMNVTAMHGASILLVLTAVDAKMVLRAMEKLVKVLSVS